MARRKKEDAQVSLFPFMSILASLIGILTLMISISMQINEQKKQGQTEEDLARAKENKTLKIQAKKLEEEIKKLKEKAEKELKAQSEMQKLQEQLKKLEEKEIPDADASPEQLRQLINMANQEAVDMKKAQPVLNKEVERLKAELAKLKEIPPPKEFVKISPPKMGSSIPRNLWFVECNGTGLVIRGPNDSEIRVTPVEAIPNNLDYLELCTKIEKMGKANAMMVFLVRTDGNNAYDWAAGVAESKFGIRLGRIPVAHNAPIDLSAFKLK
jgi:hypothetical protein